MEFSRTIGGYDERLEDNRRTFDELLAELNEVALTFAVYGKPDFQDSTSLAEAEVIFLHNFTSNQRSALLNAPSTIALLYTPSNEHFGIGPIEGMACGLPVIACDSGGPMETIIDMDPRFMFGTGWLRPPHRDDWGEAMDEIVNLPAE